MQPSLPLPAAARFPEIDFARGAAIIGMIAFHAAFDLDYFAHWSIPVAGGWWWLLARMVAAAFVFIAGISLAISAGRSGNEDTFASRTVARGLNLIALGLVITAATFIFLHGEGTIVFGVLHFIGLAIMLCIPLARKRQAALVAGVCAIAAGTLLSGITVNTPYLVWLGAAYPGFYSYDYFPLFPWIGVMLLGIAAGNHFYGQGVRRHQLLPLPSFAQSALCWLGRHSLAVYLIHQPLLIAVIAATAG